ncbi:hypothetical protein [Aquidulcibacter sp.]|uniref:hypothetical protein n=1 Tax=Aquidulcibacter sp. TaxID=2052990 RepID=UPI0028AD5D90|nr:hypothetical protein [Aquidulcibacter sp.]
MLLGACVPPSGLSCTVPNPEDAKYSSPNCRAIRAMAAEHDLTSASRSSLALSTEEPSGRMKTLPSTKDVAAYQDRRPMIEAGVRDLCTS